MRVNDDIGLNDAARCSPDTQARDGRDPTVPAPPTVAQMGPSTAYAVIHTNKYVSHLMRTKVRPPPPCFT